MRWCWSLVDRACRAGARGGCVGSVGCVDAPGLVLAKWVGQLGCRGIPSQTRLACIVRSGHDSVGSSS